MVFENEAEALAESSSCPRDVCSRLSNVTRAAAAATGFLVSGFLSTPPPPPPLPFFGLDRGGRSRVGGILLGYSGIDPSS